MTTYIGLLRAVNLGAHNKVGMRELCDCFTALGMVAPRSLLQTGNVVFGSDRVATAAIEQALEAGLEQRLGLKTDVFVRTAKEWQAVVAGNPFPDAARSDPSHLLVLCLKDAPSAAAATALHRAITGRETARVTGRQAYIVFPDGIGTSRLTPAVINRALGTSATGRNWNTVLKLAALAEAAGAKAPGRPY